MLHVIFPSDPLSANTPDTGFVDQYHAVRDAGLGVGLVTIDDNAIGLRAQFEPGTRVLYRGWMLQHSAYSALHAAIVAHGGNPVTSVEAYLGCHHLPM